MHIKCRYFSQKNLATGGVEPPPPQMPLTVMMRPKSFYRDTTVKRRNSVKVYPERGYREMHGRVSHVNNTLYITSS